MTAWHSYPKVWNIGHPKVAHIFLESRVAIQEKYDGSQFSFGVIEGKLHTKSKGQEFPPDDPPKMFAPSVEHVVEAHKKELLVEGWVYRGEAFNKPKHNTITYSRIPKGNIVLFDVETDYCTFLPPNMLAEKAEDIGVEPAEFHGTAKITSLADLKPFLEKESSLGGSLVEGVVIKNYSLFEQATGHVLMAKYVSEEFREKHKQNPEWRKSKKEFIDSIGEIYNNAARFKKAVFALRDAGCLEWEPKDIGGLIKELNRDLIEEEAEPIKEMLYKKWRNDITKRANRGFANWYKDFLAERQFEGDEC